MFVSRLLFLSEAGLEAYTRHFVLGEIRVFLEEISADLSLVLLSSRACSRARRELVSNRYRFSLAEKVA